MESMDFGNGHAGFKSEATGSSYLEEARKRYTTGQELRKQWLETKNTLGFHAITGVKSNSPPNKISLEVLDWVPVCKKPLLGMEHIAEIIPLNSMRRYYVCSLCGVCDMDVFEHIMSVEHAILYLTHNNEEYGEYIEKYFSTRPKEAGLIKPLLEAKGWPMVDMSDRDSREFKDLTSAMLDMSVFLTQQVKRKRFTKAHETEPGKPRKRQAPLVKQLIGHTTHHYPHHLHDALYYYGYNFAYDAPGGDAGYEMEASTGGYGAGAGGIPSLMGGTAPMTMGMAKTQRSGEPPAFLKWLQITESKLKTEILPQTSVADAESVKGLLECGIELFTSNPTPPTTICYYTKGAVNEATPLGPWMKLTNTFFEEAWMCSQREVVMARSLITQIDAAIQTAKTGIKPLTMGMGSVSAYDPYSAAGGDPYAQNAYDSYSTPGAWDYTYGTGYADGYEGYGAPAAARGRGRGKPYSRPGTGGRGGYSADRGSRGRGGGKSGFPRRAPKAY